MFNRFKSWLRKKIWEFLNNDLSRKLETYTIHNIQIKPEADIHKIAEDLYKLQSKEDRGKGIK